MSTPDSFKVCSICRTPIAYGAEYYACSVSTCRSKRTGLFFCSLPCFEAHLPEMRHRDAWAEQERAPTRAQAEAELAKEASASAAGSAAGSAAATERRRIVGQVASTTVPEPVEKDVLVVVSKLKKFVKDRSGMSTSDSAIAVLSDHLRWLSVEASRKAAEDGRKTVMDRDYERVIRELRRPGG
jgi:histone H3/H4